MTDSGTAPRGVVLGVPREVVAGERRVALTPETVQRLARDGATVLIESGAGEAASFLDAEYETAGASIVPDAAALYERADVVLKVQAPRTGGQDGNVPDEVGRLRSGTTLIAFLAPMVNHDLVRALAERGVNAMSMDAIPRTTRAQSMDALSSQSNIAGYKAVVVGANHLGKIFPLLMTAAGTIRPARVLILGAGVAGLQAIGTARRLGAVVEAYDVRPVVKEQVESLGAKFVEVDTGEDLSGTGGYAREASADTQRRQQEALADACARADVVVTTALVPGRPAPKLVPATTVERMHSGSVIVDLAGEAGGNCELTKPGETTVAHGVTIVSPLNLPAEVPVHSSQMYAKNMQNLLGLMLKDGQFTLNFDDDIVRGTCIVRDGEVVHEGTRNAMGLAAPEPAQPEADTAPAEPAAPVTPAESEVAEPAAMPSATSPDAADADQTEQTDAEREIAAALEPGSGVAEEAGVQPVETATATAPTEADGEQSPADSEADAQRGPADTREER